jgi:hypothetical protein
MLNSQINVLLRLRTRHAYFSVIYAHHFKTLSNNWSDDKPTALTKVWRENYNWVLQHVLYLQRAKRIPYCVWLFLQKENYLENKDHYKQIKWWWHNNIISLEITDTKDLCLISCIQKTSIQPGQKKLKIISSTVSDLELPPIQTIQTGINR